MKKMILTLTAFAAAAVLSSCAWQDRGGRDTAADNDKVLAVETGEKVAASRIYEGSDELQGQDYGVIVMPKVIEAPKIDRVYKFRLDAKQGIDDLTDGKEFFESFFGSEYNEEVCGVDSLSGWLKYGGEDCAQPSVFHNGHIEAYKNGAELLSSSSEQSIAIYQASKDRDNAMELEGGSCTVGEVCDGVEKFCRENLARYFDELDIIPSEVYYFLTSSGKKQAETACQLHYKGVPLEDYFSFLFETKPGSTADSTIITSYSPNQVIFSMDSKDEIDIIFMHCYPHTVRSEELTEIISLKGAVEILKDNLAVNSKYIFEDVKLMYCSKTTSEIFLYDPNDPKDPITINDPGFEPTWCFFWDTAAGGYGRQAIKVNAVTGEITLDINK